MIDFLNARSIVTPKGEIFSIVRGTEILYQKPTDGLPVGYTQLDHIIVPANGYFNTGVVPTGDKWTYETKIYASSWGSNDYYYFAVRQTRNYNTMYAPLIVQSGFRMYFSGTKTAAGGGSKNAWYTVKSEIQNGLQNLWVNGVLKVTDDIAITTTYTLPLYLFAANFHGGEYGGTSGRIAYLRIHKENELVRDFIPVKRDSDGVCGLFDMVERKFYTNAGSGTITGGVA